MSHCNMFIFSLWITTFAFFTNAQIPIPNRPLGFQYGKEGTSKIQLDAFLDLACPYSKKSFPVLKEVADHYGVTNLRLNVVLFPLPYHRSAFIAAQVSKIRGEIRGEVYSDLVLVWPCRRRSECYQV